MGKIPNSTELAVIFKKQDVKGDVTLFYANDIVLGHFDKKTMQFIDNVGTRYRHIIDSTKNDDYGFGLRTTVGRLNKHFHNRRLKTLLKNYLASLQLSFYYYQIDSKNQITFISEDIEDQTTYSLIDYDLQPILNRRKKQELKSMSSIECKIDVCNLAHEVKTQIIGQDEAIDDIATTLWKNSKTSSKKNMLLVGSTGVGKTAIIEAVAKRLNVPMVIVNTPGLSKSAYRGESVDDILRRLISAADNDVKKAEKGIVVLDEFDKLSEANHFQDTISTIGVQEELLKFVESGEYQINIGSAPTIPQYVTIQTKEITFIALGSFSNALKTPLEKPVGSLGFNAKLIASTKEDVLPSKITSEFLLSHGIIPELVGRFPVVITLNALTEKDLIQIIENPTINHDLNETIQLLNSVGVQLVIQNKETLYKKIASKALEKNIGARGLDSTIEELFVKAISEISKNEGIYEQLMIDEQTLENPKHYQLIKKK